jgi:hypothetical protein
MSSSNLREFFFEYQLILQDRKPQEAISMPKCSYEKFIELKIKSPIPTKSGISCNGQSADGLFISAVLITSVNFFDTPPHLDSTKKYLEVNVRKGSELFAYLAFYRVLLDKYHFLREDIDIDNPKKVIFRLFKFEKMAKVFEVTPFFYDKHIFFEFTCENKDIRDSILRFFRIKN